MKKLIAPVTSIVMIALVNQSVHAGPANGTSPDPTFSTGGVFNQRSGKAIYEAVCAGCHMLNGEGAKGAGFYPVLSKNPRLASPAYPEYVVVHGLRGMPPIGPYLSDQQVADVVTYIRTSFGNQYPDPVKIDDIAKIRTGK
ncbi:c-type cytochrome [Pandoraea anhela]|uniref:Cytochrome C oxidase n=1 Tax=Pandoraea anhela TaxID=2508295 RepID=A0A5E4YRP4_9BURK|nr:cytochrome c [Pandoraea anhela]VVE51554.1 cytochrome C oxidase [Pandoraea anhela]